MRVDNGFRGTLEKMNVVSAASIVIIASFGILVARPAAHPQERPSAAHAPLASPGAGEILNKYCISCHNTRIKTAGLALDSLDLTRVGDDAEIWEKVAIKFRTGEMPPPGRPRPDAATYAAITSTIEAAL